MSQVLVLAAGAGGAEGGSELPLSPEAFGIIAIIAFVALLGLTWTFRGSSNKHD